jgi:hypothetical protein
MGFVAQHDGMSLHGKVGVAWHALLRFMPQTSNRGLLGRVNKHPLAHHTLDACYASFSHEPQSKIIFGFTLV